MGCNAIAWGVLAIVPWMPCRGRPRSSPGRVINQLGGLHDYSKEGGPVGGIVVGRFGVPLLGWSIVELQPDGQGLPLWCDPSRSPRWVRGIYLFGVIGHGAPGLWEDIGQCMNFVQQTSSLLYLSKHWAKGLWNSVLLIYVTECWWIGFYMGLVLSLAS